MVVPSLAVLHTVFVREHNRIAKEIYSLNTHWDGEKIFQETRKIVSSLIQLITYFEYLPTILGRHAMKTYKLETAPNGHNTVYNNNIDTTIANVFGVAAFRFGHSQIPDTQSYVDLNYKIKKGANIEKTFNRGRYILRSKGCSLDGIGRWLISDNQMQDDRFIENGVRNLLFLDKTGNSFDLAALNIQRGRDHGIPSYNTWRKWCRLPVAFHFRKGPGGLIDILSDTVPLLDKIYKYVSNFILSIFKNCT